MRADLGPCHAARLRAGRDPHRLYLQRPDRPRPRPEIRALRFDPELGQSGGEDSDYFARVVLMGGRIDYAPEARVTEPVALDRLSFGWLARAALPDGLTHAGVLMRRHGVSPWRAVPVAMAKLLACAALRWPSQGIAGGAQRRRCAGCFMPAWWPASSVAGHR
jgi:hypothetical protein